MSAPEDLWAIATMANRIDGAIHKTVSEPRFTVAVSEDEATGKGMRMVREKWPAADGWAGHSACAIKAPREVIASLAALHRSEEDQSK